MKKIMIVDDEPMMLKLAERILKEHYATVCVTSGSEALKIFGDEKPDMILSDLHMPEMDGYELWRTLQETIGEVVPIMFMTTDNSDASESRGFEIGAADYIRKPLKEEILLSRIDNILRNEAKINALKKAAAIDPLTKLLNKGAAKREIGELVKNVSGCLLMVDLDSFKPVNDLYGHAMGDKILIRFAGLLRSITRSNDCVGRVGGDEFIVFLREVNSKEVIGQKVIYLNEELTRSACEYMGDDMSVPIGVSVGGVFVPENGTDFAELSRLADQALYTVKENGKHGVFIFDRHQSAKAETKVQNLKVIRRVMDERGEATDALLLDIDRFTAIYRWAVRRKEYGQAPTARAIIRFFLTPKDESAVWEYEHIEKAAHRFQGLLLTVLSPSDCVARYGNLQFLALVDDIEAIPANIVNAWNELPEADDWLCGADCETL